MNFLKSKVFQQLAMILDTKLGSHNIKLKYKTSQRCCYIDCFNKVG